MAAADGQTELIVKVVIGIPCMYVFPQKVLPLLLGNPPVLIELGHGQKHGAADKFPDVFVLNGPF